MRTIRLSNLGNGWSSLLHQIPPRGELDIHSWVGHLVDIRQCCHSYGDVAITEDMAESRPREAHHSDVIPSNSISAASSPYRPSSRTPKFAIRKMGETFRIRAMGRHTFVIKQQQPGTKC